MNKEEQMDYKLKQLYLVLSVSELMNLLGEGKLKVSRKGIEVTDKNNKKCRIDIDHTRRQYLYNFDTATIKFKDKGENTNIKYTFNDIGW